jgi:DNA-binding NarL/FixJ family response regulator
VKLFIVEDSPMILENLVTTLEELTPGQVVGTAADEATAVAWLSQRGHNCDLVIIDIFLKAGSGVGVLREARRLGLSAKRVMLTNYAAADLRRTCADLGADRVFDKSTDVEALIAYCTGLQDGADNAAAVPH